MAKTFDSIYDVPKHQFPKGIEIGIDKGDIHYSESMNVIEKDFQFKNNKINLIKATTLQEIRMS